MNQTLVGMIAGKIFDDICLMFFYPTASAYSQRPKFLRAEHSATAEGENHAYGPTLNLEFLLLTGIFPECINPIELLKLTGTYTL